MQKVKNKKVIIIYIVAIIFLCLYLLLKDTFNIAVWPQYDYACDFSEGLACVEVNKKSGYIDKTGKMVIKPQFELADNFKDGRAVIRVDNKYGYINKKGEIVIKPEFLYAGLFSEGLAAVLACPVSKTCTDDNIKNYIPADTYAKAEEWGYKWGFIDKDGNYKIEPQYSRADSFSEGLANVILNKEVLFIDKKNRPIIRDIRYYIIHDFKEGLVPFCDRQKKKWGYLDKQGKIAIEPIYENASSFNDGLAVVYVLPSTYSAKPLSAVINKKGLVVIKPEYYIMIHNFSEGFAKIEGVNNKGFIDRKGNDVIFQTYSNVTDFKEGYAGFSPDGKTYGFLNTKGNWVIMPIFENISSFNEGLAVVQYNGKLGYIRRPNN